MNVESCRDAESALKRLAAQNFSMIVAEWDQPAVATTVFRVVRESPERNECTLVAVMDGATSAQQAFTEGANFVLYKPLSVEKARFSLQAALRLQEEERRGEQRIPIQVSTAISFAGQDEVPVDLLNLSRTGTTLQTRHNIPAGAKLYFNLLLPGRKDAIRLAGQVVWQDSGNRSGVKFVGVPTVSRRLLDDWSRSPMVTASGSSMTATAGASNPASFSARSPARLATAPPSPSSTAPAASAPASVSASASSRRDELRIECSLGVQVMRPGPRVPHWCTLTDLSSTGCYIEIPTPFPEDATLDIEVRTADLKIRLRGVVRSVSPGFGMGLRFTPENDAQVKQVQDLLQHLHDAAGNGKR